MDVALCRSRFVLGRRRSHGSQVEVSPRTYLNRLECRELPSGRVGHPGSEETPRALVRSSRKSVRRPLTSHLRHLPLCRVEHVDWYTKEDDLFVGSTCKSEVDRWNSDGTNILTFFRFCR